MHEPPVQSDCCVLSGNYHLESNPERHAKTPLAAATGNRMCERCIESSWSGARTAATLKGQIWWHVSHKTVTTVQKFPNLLNLRKTALQGGFFVYRARDYDEAEWISRFHLACHPIIQSFGVVLTRSPWFVTYPPQGISFFIFLMICTKSVVRNNLSSLNKHIQKQWLCFISPQ